MQTRGREVAEVDRNLNAGLFAWEKEEASSSIQMLQKCRTQNSEDTTARDGGEKEEPEMNDGGTPGCEDASSSLYCSPST